MNAAREMLGLRDNLTALRAGSVKLFALLISVLGYSWLMWTLSPESSGITPPIYAWIGSGSLILSIGLSYILRDRHLNLASVSLIGGAFLATTCAILTFRMSDFAYLFVLPIILSSVLLSHWVVFLVSAAAVLLTIVIGPRYTGESLSSPGIVFPIVMMTLVALASWLSARNLYTALAWVWSGYEQARQNEDIARRRAGELRRALKALDEGTHRLERTNHMLAVTRDQAEEARRLKQQFAQTISHELRTPLNLIVGFTELMAETPEYYGARLSPAYLRDLSVVYRNACHLQDLVNDVLDLARIEAAQMTLLPEETDPGKLAQEALDTVRSLVETHGLTPRLETEPDLPFLWMDPVRIRQVLFNLLNNAVRFTEYGGITVRVCQQGKEVVFAITDTGAGIAPEDIDHIFEEFYQADGGTRRRHAGAGLGLAVSRRFVKLHGGRMWVESQIGQGSTFYFTLPTDRTDVVAAFGRRLVEPISSVSGRGSQDPVLVAVTRSLSAAALLTRYVHNCRTVVISDLEDARRVIQDLMPQAVVVDQAYLELDGLDAQALAREWGLSRAPLIACSLPGENEVRQRLTIDGYLVKPISRQSIWDVMRRLGEGIDRVLIVDDDRDFVRLLSRILQDSPVRRYEVSNAYTGQQALTKMRQQQPDLVLLDLRLPDMDGLQLIDRIRSISRWQDIPIIIVSAQEEVDYQEALQGAMIVSKANGLMPGELVRWIQSVADTTITSRPMP